MAQAPIEYTGGLWSADREVSASILTAAEEAREYGLALVRQRTPVDKGLLKASWKAEVVPGGIRWENKAPYAGYVELGTKRMQPRHMLTDSLPAIEQVFEQALAKQIGTRLGSKVISGAGSEFLSYSSATPLGTKLPGSGNRKPGLVQRLQSRFQAILGR